MTALYRLLRPLLFRLDPESSHGLAIGLLAALSRSPTGLAGVRRLGVEPEPVLRRRVMGLDVAHPIGLAAGLDKHARAFPALAALGFSFVELGTVTPIPQPGNPRPRLFRLNKDAALINRMGFNSIGLEALMHNFADRRQNCQAVVGINIGKNATTPVDAAVDDYLTGLDAAYPLADYVAINVSSPNTQSLRELQRSDRLAPLLKALRERRQQLGDHHQQHRPIALKVAPDLGDETVKHIAELAVQYEMDGIIATNTTVARPAGLQSRASTESGGLSGRPLQDAATQVIAKLYEQLRGELPIIGAGGVGNWQDAREKFAAGAELIQIYTSFVYQGPAVIRNIIAGLSTWLATTRTNDLSSALAQLREHPKNNP